MVKDELYEEITVIEDDFDEKDPTVPECVKKITPEDIEKWNTASGEGSTEETDPTVPQHVKSITEQDITNWNSKQPAGDYALKSDIPTVPKNVSEFTNDVGYLKEHQDISKLQKHVEDNTIHVTQEEKESWNNKSDFSGSYDDLSNKPTIPDVSKFITEEDVDKKIDSKITSKLEGEY